MKSKKTAIIITSYNQNKILNKCLYSLRKKTNYRNYRVFLVDDSGTGKIAEDIKEKYSWVNAAANKKNLGFARSNNVLIKRALKNYNPDYILMLNDDTEIIQKNWLSEMIKAGESDDKIGILGCQLVYSDGSLQWFAKNNMITFYESPGNKKKMPGIEKTQEVENIIGALFLIKRKVIDTIGILDEAYSPFYGEESDFCYRAKKKGFKCVYVGSVKSIHHRNKTISNLNKNKVWWIKKRNLIRMEWSYFGFLRNIKHGAMHIASVFFNREKRRLNIDFPVKLALLASAYLANIIKLNEIIRKRFE